MVHEKLSKTSVKQGGSSVKYSLIQVEREYDGMVDGVWLQNHTGTMDSAAEEARATEKANSNRIKVAVVEDLGYSEPNYSFRTALKRLDFAQGLNVNSSMNIQFVEKEPWRNNERYTGGCDMYPTFMVKDGAEFFMFNRRSDQTSYEAEADDARKKQLLDNGGRFFRFHGYKETPHEYLRVMIERRHSFDKFSHKEVEWSDDGMYCDFSGNSREVSAAFHYRIYDKELATNIEKIVGLIHKKKHKEALEVLNTCEKGISVECKPSLEGQMQQAEAHKENVVSSSNTEKNEIGR